MEGEDSVIILNERKPQCQYREKILLLRNLRVNFMGIVNYIIVLLLFCLAPAGVIWLCRRVSFFEKLGPIMVLYAIGMVVGNLHLMPSEFGAVQEFLPNLLIPLAIPMMLFSCSFSKNQVGLQVKIVLSGFISVALAVVSGYLIFGENLPQGSQIGGLISGMYTGGTLNAAALQAIFKIDSEMFVLINSYDIIISFVYFVFLFTGGIKMFRYLLGQKKSVAAETFGEEVEMIEERPSRNSYKKFLTKGGLVQLAKVFGVALLVVALSAAVSLLFPQSWFMVIFILMITTLGVVCSFIPQVKRFDISYDIGMYLIYIFSITIASMADFSNLDFEKGISLLCFLILAVFVSLLLHALFCRLMRVDADSMVISSVAFINSPPFVPMVAAVMKNKNALVTGLAAGIVGYAAGNHLGVLIAQLLGAF